ncbi:MAG: UDP-N-acetylglucosamine 2-epimerase (non-hydrolyzing) [Flavobacteriaceae bacterium]|nr:UDP-N-acetylglucosamine 2-epimerase (non-hydrolyzing) [Bacteroidia bacterium]NND10437.1 UDP-N-acetylglucosamine 2-epimerase (non-hydrolyzing) [Flavobacteriaceae bacterium]NNK29188.1 UDP-N-acetylglucosamine 2-epimerase (non-hydrolyzing) [Flavobacteriaceae bacterium]NNL59994.1 UDP-N-acetylglucosamine 2-epimerase (non-hydrolyzing) [Flavobacteriaceae bacterium]RZV65468.1 MAG: UDP-N-acetylglucosamine 2-epimerase (non-hydrolyzing) [Flavobacteriaceae bacterium]
MNITIVAGARPNFMKIAPIMEAISNKKEAGHDIDFRLVHTGQHYDKNLSDTFFQELNIPFPDINLNVKSGTQAEQTAAIMIAFEKELRTNPCDLVLVVGDVTSTMACTIVAKKEGVKVAHVEAGIRSGDMRMPEEINRIVTDSLTDYFFTTSSYANDNLIKLGVDQENIFFSGNVMIDTLLKNRPRFEKPDFWEDLSLTKKKYMVMTLHRPSNVDGEQRLRSLLKQITTLGKDYPIVFPVHPRTKKVLEGLDLNFENLHYVDPMGYLAFNYLVENAFTVLTDSGGITEETTVMNVPCITLRDSTERPETCIQGTNMLVGNDPEKMEMAFSKLLSGNWPSTRIPELWDGKAADRIANYIIGIYNL